ncbi:MAG: nuclear transport factor 2 family protein [Saprospiraceae bacterium]|nr:nuclear transport factor 2 family protein [Saprospiraceae bacterium]
MDKYKRELVDKTFQTFMVIGLSGENLDLLHDLVANDVVGFGTTLDEKIFGLKELQGLLKRQKEQSAGLELSWKINTLDVHISNDENTAIFTNEIVLYIPVDGNLIEMYMRFSVVLEYAEDKWMVVHWHGSKPEHVMSVKDTFGIETWKEKAEELEKQVAERTADLVEKNRELAIEAAMEKVRSRSLAMLNPGELMEVAELLRAEMGQLGVEELETSSIYLVDHEYKAECWYAIKDIRDGNKELVSDEMSLSLNETWVGMEMWKFFNSSKEQDSIIMKGDNRKEWINYCAARSQVLQGYYGDEIPERTYHLIKFLGGYMGAASPGEISTESWDLLKRAATVFSFAYTRFKDLQDAAARTREAQIELALERVRSRSLTIHKSEDLKEVIVILFDNLKELQIPFSVATLAIRIDGSKDLNSFVCGKNEEGLVFTNYRLPYFDNKIPRDLNNALEKQLDFFVGQYSKEEKDSFFKYNFEHTPEFLNIPEKTKSMIFGSQLYTISMVPFKYAAFSVNDFEGKVLSQHHVAVVKRFGRVFDQAYTRFLDIKRAESQAREAQIEASMERVRAHAMGLRESEDLGNIIAVIFEELQKLGLELYECSLFFRDGNSRQFTVWGRGTSGDSFLSNYQFIFLDHPVLNAVLEDLERKVPYREFSLEEEEIRSYGDLIFSETDFKYASEEYKQTFYALKKVFTGQALFMYGFLEAVGTEPLPGDLPEVLQRFTQVVDLTYTRYLDLQKAEAQAKEVQIELSLERIRSRVTAMQESSDLLDIVVSMRSEFVKLGHEAHYFWHMRWLPERYDKAMTSGDGTKIGMVMTLPRHIHGDIAPVANWEKSNESTHVLAMDAETAVDYVHKMITLGDFERVDPQSPTLDDIRKIGGLTFVMARTTHGEIGFSLPGVVLEPSKNAVDTLVRFAGVFDLAYKRFEDLKTAEKDLIEIKAAREKAEEALLELKATQSQLIQQEN